MIVRLVDRMGYTRTLDTPWPLTPNIIIPPPHSGRSFAIVFWKTEERDAFGSVVYRPSPMEAHPIRYPDRPPSDLRVDFSLEPPYGHP